MMPCIEFLADQTLNQEVKHYTEEYFRGSYFRLI